MKENKAPEKLYLFENPISGTPDDIMKAPEKIYMPNELLSEEWQRHIEGEDVEYVRADAFIEKALEWIKENIRPYYHEVRYKYEDFEKYMKGE